MLANYNISEPQVQVELNKGLVKGCAHNTRNHCEREPLRHRGDGERQAEQRRKWERETCREKEKERKVSMS